MSGARLSIVLPSMAGGGAERAVGLVANGLAARGVQVTMVLGQATGPYLRDLHPAVRVLNLGARTMPQALPGLVRHLRQDAPTALLSAMNHVNVVAALAHRLARSKARLVLSERVHLAPLFAEFRGPRMALTRALMRWTYPRADAVVTVAEAVTQDLLARLPMLRGRVCTVYNPVVDDTLLTKAACVPAHPWLLQAAEPVVLAAGRLIAQKDFATLLEAFALLRAHRPARLLILGDGELRASLEAQAQRLGLSDVVAMPGFEPNPFAAMRAAGLFVLSSRFEGLPGVLIQAMACGARVVSTRCPSGPEEVLENGRWGRLVPVGDAAAMATAMLEALDDPHPPDVATRAADFTVTRAVQQYAEVLGLV